MLSTTYRNQWAGFSGGPTTMLISGHRSLPNGIGAGLILYNDDMGGAISQSGLDDRCVQRFAQQSGRSPLG